MPIWGGGSFDILDDLTLAAWIKPRSISTYNAIAGQGHFQTSTYGYGLQITQAEGIRFQIRMMSAGYHAIVQYTLDGLWHHVVGVRDGTNIFLYVDGQLADKSTAPLGALGSTRKFGVGAVDHGTSWNYYFKGSIADVQLWNRALSEAEVAAMIGRRLDGDEVGLTGYWPFNEGAGDVAYDLMLQPHDANLVNTTWDFDSVLEFDKDEYIVAPRFYLANLTSGSRLFTNSGELKIDSLPVPEGYNAYQVTQGAAVTAIDPSGWLPAEAPWVNISYDKPATESNLCFYAWYTNTITAVALMRSEANISYTLVPPNARIRTTLMRKLEGDQPTVIEPKDLDSGSSGGLANKINMEITGRHLHLVSGPGADLTPLQPAVTLAVAGDYEIVLIVQNEAGNSATSTAAQVSIQENSEITPFFYNSSSYIDLGTPDALQIDSDHPFTVETWVKFSHLSGRDVIFCKSNGRATPYSYILGFADNTMAAWDGSAYRGNFPAIRETGRWYHVAFSFDGTNMGYYLDGELLGKAEYSFKNSTLHNVKIGGHLTDMSFRGMISDLRVWDYARNRVGLLSTMGVRLQGGDRGLLGYWPLREGVGEEVYDHSGNGTTGVLSQVLWSADEELFAIVGEEADYLVAHPFRLVDPLCGSSKFTAGTTVDIAAAPLPDGYSHYQVTSAAASSNLLATGWQPVATLPDSLSFEQPSGSTTLVKYIWFTNLTASVKLQRSVADIIYSDTLPVAQVKPTYQRQLIPGSALEVHLADIDNGSSTATFFGETVPFKEKHLILLDGPGGAPAAGEFVTLPAVGNYQIVLVIKDILGHAATSTPAVVTVTLWQNEAFVWQGADNGCWSDPRNWGLLGVPPAGADVTIGAGAIVVLDYATPLLSSVTFAGSQLVFDGAAAKLNGTAILVNSGKLSHTPSGATESDADGIWPAPGAVMIECHNFTLAAAAKIDVTGCGYGAGYQSDGYGPGGGALGNGDNSNYSGGGGGHGGQGGQYQSRGSGGPAYDNYRKPQMAGSGGGGRLNYNYRGGAGGGVVRIASTERLVVDGVMMANGQDSSYYCVGGGAGGAIWLSCRKLAGSGTIQADGGKAGNNSGAGAGGRIAIWRATDALGSELQVSAVAGSGDDQNGLEDGTVFWKLLEGTILMLR